MSQSTTQLLVYELENERGMSPLPEESKFRDSSGPLFSMYSKIAQEEDNKTAERWQKDADGILIFTGLFSAAVASLLSVSIQDIRQNSQDTSAFYLKNINQLLFDQSTSRPSIPSTVSDPPAFSPPTYAIWVNVLWFLSLGISITCAVMATMLQQWARQYLRFTQLPLRSPDRQARVRALFSGSIDKLFIESLSALLPCYLHLSVLLFFVGLLIFSFNVNHSIFIATLSLFGFSIAIYSFFTILPLFQSDNLLSTPVYPLPGSLIAFGVCIVLTTFGHRFNYKIWGFFEWFFGDVGRVAEAIALQRSSRIDFRVLDSTLYSLGDDDTEEKFFECIPGFFRSKAVNLPTGLPSGIRHKFKQVLDAFLDRTFLSNMVSESIKIPRLIICLNASYAALGPDATLGVLYGILDKRFEQVPQSIEMASALARWCTTNEQRIAEPARCIVARILANLRERDDRWIALAVEQFGLPERVLRDQIGHGDSAVLSLLIHMVRQAIRSGFWTLKMLSSLSNFNIRDTLPGLQHDFCALWNEIVSEARNEGADSTPTRVLSEIRHVYITLHQGTTATPTLFSASTGDDNPILSSPSSYPFCDIASHISAATAHVHTAPPPDIPLSLPSISHLGQRPAYVPDAPQELTQGVPSSIHPNPHGSQPFPTAPIGIASDNTNQGRANTSTNRSAINLVPPSSSYGPPQHEGAATNITSSPSASRAFPLPNLAPVAPASLSPSPVTSHHSIPPQSTDSFRIPTAARTPSTHDHTQDSNRPIPLGVYRPPVGWPSVTDLAADDLRPGDSDRRGQNQRS